MSQSHGEEYVLALRLIVCIVGQCHRYDLHEVLVLQGEREQLELCIAQCMLLCDLRLPNLKGVS